MGNLFTGKFPLHLELKNLQASSHFELLNLLANSHCEFLNSWANPPFHSKFLDSWANPHSSPGCQLLQYSGFTSSYNIWLQQRINHVNQSESRTQIFLQFDWMVRFSLLQPDQDLGKLLYACTVSCSGFPSSCNIRVAQERELCHSIKLQDLNSAL